MAKTALITGATSGIGAAYAKKLANQGYDLILTGRRREIIQKLADDLVKQFDIKAKVIIAELSNDTDIQSVVDAVKTAENLEILINNAGYEGVPRFFAEQGLSEHEQMIKVLITVPLRLIYAALPEMSKNKRGVIINISSGAAYFPLKRAAVYAASKAFLKLFSETLYLEVKNKGIKVQAVCPGYIETDFYRDFPKEAKSSMSKSFKAMSPESVVECSLKELSKNRVVCIPGTTYKVLPVLIPFLPRNYFDGRMDKSLSRSKKAVYQNI